MLKSTLHDYNSAYIFLQATITAAANTPAAPDRNNKQVIFKNCAPFTDCINEINNAQEGNTMDPDIATPTHNLEDSDKYSNI